jgi:hypothetical protein
MASGAPALPQTGGFLPGQLIGLRLYLSEFNKKKKVHE